MKCPVAIDPHHLATLIQIAETFAEGAPNEKRFFQAIDYARAELEGAGHDVEELIEELNAMEAA